MTTIDPMAPNLKALLADERLAASKAAPGKARVLARVEKTIAMPPGGGGGGGDGGGGASPGPGAGAAGAVGGAGAKIVAAFVAGGIAGGALVFGLMPPKAPLVENVQNTPKTSAPAVTAVAPRIERPAASPEPAPSESVAATPVDSAGPRVDSLAAERALLDPARTALGRHDAASALDAVRKHEAKFASGKMTEEREAIAIQALVLAGRQPEASARAGRFRQRFPGSVLLPAVEAALGSGNEADR